MLLIISSGPSTDAHVTFVQKRGRFIWNRLGFNSKQEHFLIEKPASSVLVHHWLHPTTLAPFRGLLKPWTDNELKTFISKCFYSNKNIPLWQQKEKGNLRMLWSVGYPEPWKFTPDFIQTSWAPWTSGTGWNAEKIFSWEIWGLPIPATSACPSEPLLLFTSEVLFFSRNYKGGNMSSTLTHQNLWEVFSMQLILKIASSVVFAKISFTVQNPLTCRIQ